MAHLRPKMRTPLTRILIDSKVAYQSIQKRNYKFAYSIEFENISIFHSSLIQKCRMKDRLFKTAKKTKYIHKVDLCKCASFIDMPLPQAQKMAKHFHSIKDVSLPFNTLSTWNLKSVIVWLSIIKHIEKLKLEANACILDPMSKYELRKCHKKLFNIIRMKKLKKSQFILGKMNLDYLKPLFEFKTHSSSNTDLSIYSDAFFPKLESEFIENHISISHMIHLTSLSLFVEIHTEALVKLLISIPQPSKLTCLGLKISNQYEDLRSLGKAIEIHEKLDSINLKLIQAPSKNQLSFQAFEFLQQRQIKHFEIEFLSQGEEEIVALGYLIGHLKSLKILKIKVEGKICDSIPECFVSFFNQLSNLTHIKLLDLYILTHAQFNTKIPGLLSIVNDCLEKLTEIEELGFRHARLDFSEKELENFLGILMKRAKSLKRVEMNFNGDKIQPNSLLKILKLIKSFRSLETIALDNLDITGKATLKKLANALSKAQTLEFIRMENMNIQNRRSVLFINMLEDILSKPGLKYFHCNLVWGLASTVLRNSPKINIGKYIKKNPRLRNVYLPPGASNLGFGNIGILKWSDGLICCSHYSKVMSTF